MARQPKKLSEAQKAEVETLAAVLTAEQIADYFCIGRRTFYSLMQRDEDIAARYKRGKARAVGSVAKNLIAKARSGNVTAMIFYLKTQAGWRETQGIEHSGQDGRPLRFDAVTLAPLVTVQDDAAAFVARMTELRDRALAAQMTGTDDPGHIGQVPGIGVRLADDLA